MAEITLYSATITLFLVMDPLGIIPIILTTLKDVPAKRRPWIILREMSLAFVILALFLLFGQDILNDLSISQPALRVAGGIILFLISLNMIFPNENLRLHDPVSGEPFIVPIAIPLIAGPSALTTVILFASQYPDHNLKWIIAILLSTIASTIIFLFSNQLRTLLGEKGLIALERMMGMVLTALAVQM